ncbi:P63C domain protein [Bacillus sp. THAF10]|uniref:P63C domain-containing protein n=1 Tax=Bacillus sp. THAF10 TaxID=2587848 RepID=UPI0012682CCB|nr:P63C domain-containing protein [Bacillus sp. THAF10]QFT90837.1 P63C domain protein [Bacillus sp. THAF10]
MDVQNYHLVNRCLKMPHANMVGYFKINKEVIYCALGENEKVYFDTQQKELVEKYITEINKDSFVELPRAVVNDSEFRIGETKLVCSVLNDGRRVIKDTSLFPALDRSRKGEKRIDGFPAIIGSKALAELFNKLYPNQVDIISPFDVAQFNGRTGKWYDANVLPIICDLYMEAEKEKLITPSQEHVLKKAKILLRSLAKVGITALIDEATNYQEVRGKDELQLLLEKFISNELRPYSAEFPHEYFEQLFRLYGLPYDPTTNKRPRYFAQFNIKYVYELLPPTVWEKLDEMNPVIRIDGTSRYYRKYRIHQYLTEDKGLRFLREHLQSLIPVMKLSKDIDDFRANFNAVFADKIKSINRMKEEQEYQLSFSKNKED